MPPHIAVEIDWRGDPGVKHPPGKPWEVSVGYRHGPRSWEWKPSEWFETWEEAKARAAQIREERPWAER